MKILFITFYKSGEVRCGGSVRNMHLANALAKCGTIYTTVLGREKEGVDSEYVRFRPYFRAKRTGIRQSRFIILCWLLPFMDWAFLGKNEILEKLGWAGERFDLVVTRFAFLVTDMAAWKIAPVVCDIDDLPSEDFDTLKKPHLAWWHGKKWSWLTRRFQGFMFRKCMVTWLPNHEQLPIAAKYSPCIYLPNVVKHVPPDFDNGIAKHFQLMSIGWFRHPPNVHGIDWFLENVWDDVRQMFPRMEYAIVGRDLAGEYVEKWGKKPGVRLLGFVDDLDVVYAESLAVVTPIFVGGGTAVKVIEAMAHGSKIFATSFAVRGLSREQIDNAHISVFSDATSFCRQLAEYVSMPDESKARLKADAICVAEKDYSVEAFSKTVSNTINRVMVKCKLLPEDSATRQA